MALDPAWQSIFRAAIDRLSSFEPERCREVELGQLRALRVPAPRPAMLRELVRVLETLPAEEAHRDRCHDTLRRLFVAMQKAGAPADSFRMAANAYLDGQHELAARWLDLDTLLRPWGER